MSRLFKTPEAAIASVDDSATSNNWQPERVDSRCVVYRSEHTGAVLCIYSKIIDGETLYYTQF